VLYTAHLHGSLRNKKLWREKQEILLQSSLPQVSDGHLALAQEHNAQVERQLNQQVGHLNCN
jgi:hypothetical protein